MSSRGRRAVPLGDVEPAGSRHLGRRSAILLTDDGVIAGTADGDVRAFDRELTERWHVPGDEGSVVAACAFEGNVLVGERGPAGWIRCYDRASGTERWRHGAAADVGDPQKETRFFLPFVADAVTDGERAYVAARRYERRDGERCFRSVVYAFRPDGTVDWRYRTDASPISLDVRDERIAVAYNRCPGEHQCGLVVLDRESGDERLTWDPGTEGQRRVGDVALLPDGLALASHGDYHGYRLDDRGGERWRVPLATPEPVDGETVYAYPNHVHATEAGVAFVTGNTYPAEGRQTDARHPNEHTAVGIGPEGERWWRAPVGGFATGIGTAGDVLAVPGAQHFRDRTADVHGLRVFDLADGQIGSVDTEGVVSAAAVADGTVAAVEEPVAYHDGDGIQGEYRLHLLRID